MMGTTQGFRESGWLVKVLRRPKMTGSTKYTFQDVHVDDEHLRKTYSRDVFVGGGGQNWILSQSQPSQRSAATKKRADQLTIFRVLAGERQ